MIVNSLCLKNTSYIIVCEKKNTAAFLQTVLHCKYSFFLRTEMYGSVCVYEKLAGNWWIVTSALVWSLSMVYQEEGNTHPHNLDGWANSTYKQVSC